MRNSAFGRDFSRILLSNRTLGHSEFLSPMHKTSTPKTVYIFIDAANLWEVQKSKRRLLDYQKLETYIKQRYSAIQTKVFYYEAYPADGTRPYSLAGKHKFYVFLKKRLGFEVRTKPLKRINIQTEANQMMVQEKGNMDVEMTIDIVHHAEHYDIAVLLTGDSDFYALLKYLRARDKKVFIMSSKSSVSQELRTGGDGYMDITQIPQSGAINFNTGQKNSNPPQRGLPSDIKPI